MQLTPHKLPFPEADAPICWQIAMLRTPASFVADEDWDEFVSSTAHFLLRESQHLPAGLTVEEIAEALNDDLSDYRKVQDDTARPRDPWDLTDRLAYMNLLDEWADLIDAWSDTTILLQPDFNEHATRVENNIISLLSATRDRSLVVEQWTMLHSTEFVGAVLARADVTEQERDTARFGLEQSDPDFIWEEFLYYNNLLPDEDF